MDSSSKTKTMSSICRRRTAVTTFMLFSAVLLLLLFSPPSSAADGPEVVVRGLENDAPALANVHAALAVPAGLVEGGNINERWLGRFVSQVPEKVRAALEPFGYYHASVKVSLAHPDGGLPRIVVDISPGESVRLTRVEVKIEGPGAAEPSLDALVRKFPLKEGDVLRQDVYEEAKGKIKSRAAELGYLRADFAVHEIFLSKEASTAEIALTLDTGPRYRFGATSFEGGSEYPAPFLSRYLAYKPGETFSFDKLGKTQLNLMNSERFGDIIITPEKEEAEGLDVPVVVRMKSLPTKRLRMGAGYGTDTGPRVLVEYKDVDMFHSGHELTANLNVSTLLQGVSAGYIIPSVRDLDSLTGFTLSVRREHVTTYTSNIILLEADRTRSLGKGRLGTLFFKVQEEHYSITSEKSNARLLMPGLRFSLQRFDSLIRPTKGHRLEVEIEGTHQALGSSMGLIRLVADGNIIVPLPWRLLLLTRLKAGVTFQNKPLDQLPASLRFFAGGDRSVRGYSYQGLGPKDSTGAVIGGKHVLVGSVELDRELFRDWGVAVFYDAGNSFNALNDITLFQGAGVGARYYTRIGALKLDFARQVGVPNPGFRIHFTVGFQL
jgi:translocation and assembly module TamA